MSRGTILQFDFETSSGWATETAAGAGTIDVRGSTQGSAGVRAVLSASQATAAITSGPLPLRNGESNLAKLTLSFNLSASAPRPVYVRVESYNAQKVRTGGVETTVFPAAADFYQRYAFELSAARAVGGGAFNALDSYVSFTFEMRRSDGWTNGAAHEIRLDNVHYAKPALYVSAEGNDSNDGLTEQTALASPQKAVDLAVPGDIIVLMNGTYGPPAGSPVNTATLTITKPGSAGGWISIKNYPGHCPIVSASCRRAVWLTGSKTTPDVSAAYIEFRGLHIRGNGDTAREQLPNEIGTDTLNVSAHGVHIDGRETKTKLFHHIRFEGCTIEYCTGDGFYIDYTDWLAIESCNIRNNCWTTVSWVPAGIAIFHCRNFDAVENVHKYLISGNHISGNWLHVKNAHWSEKVKTSFYNGNGILLDDNIVDPADFKYAGRTLVQNNLVFNNAGGGVQMWGYHRADVVNNTIHLNGAKPELKWGQIGMEMCNDIRLLNNIVVAQADVALDSWYPHRLDTHTSNIVRENNLWKGGIRPPLPGANDIFADPAFVHPCTEPASADFRLKPDSAASHAGQWTSITPPVDITGKIRPTGVPPTLGAYEG